MRVVFSYYDIAPSMGRSVKALLKGHNHYDRLSKAMPNLSKVQLVSTLQGPSVRLPMLKGPGPFLSRSEKLSVYDCWSLHSLPAQHICQTPYHERENSFFLGDRPSPDTMVLHAFDQGQTFSILEPIGNTGGRVIIILKRPLWSPVISGIIRHGASPNDPCIWRKFENDIQELLGSRIPTRFWDPSNTKFEVYGWLGECLGCSITLFREPQPPCTCGAKVRRITRMAQNMQYLVSTRKCMGLELIPVSTKFGFPGEIPTCTACDEF
jgi:hypothetical protein